MLAITQFEVLVYEHGRWTVHARYPSDQRKAAVMDARSTEFNTGHPTKVIAETYFPEINESELVTAYISPKARDLREAAKATKRNAIGPVAGRAAAAAAFAKRRRLAMRPGFSLRQVVLQGIVAGAMSLIAATASTALISWGLRRSIEAGLPVSSNMSSTILTYTYAIFFLFFFMSLFRSRLPLHRLLSYLWANSAETKEKPKETLKSVAAAIAPRIRPKKAPAAIEAEAARAREELKVMRGDPLPEPEIEIFPAPVAVIETPAVLEPPPPPPPETASERKKREKRERKEAEERARADAVAAAAAAKAAAEAAAQAALAPPPDPLPLERAVLRRFVAEVVRPATAGTMPDDPVTRRGVSLVIAGAAAALSETARTSDTNRLLLIEDTLQFLGMTPASVAMFMHQYDALVAVPANASLVALGRSALTKHLEGADVARILASTLAGWRTPHGQPTGVAPAETPAVAPPDDIAPHDIYLLTELRMGAAFALTPEGLPDNAAEAARDGAMGLHNSIVRSVLSTFGGHEVKHTGGGIFAQFKQASAALAAASEIQRRFTASYGAKLAVGVIANTNNDDDPLLNANMVRQAQTAVAQALDGEVLAERRVRKEAGLLAAENDFDSEGDESALVKVSTESEAEEPALYEHIADHDIRTSVPGARAVNAS